MHAQSLTGVNSFQPPWTVAHQAPLSMQFIRQEYWSGVPFPTSGDTPKSGTISVSPESLALAGGFFTTERPGEPPYHNIYIPQIVTILITS